MKITVKEFVKLDIQGLMQINGGTSACGNYTQTQPATPPSGGNETNNAPSNNGGNTGGSGSDTPSSYSPSYSNGSTTGTSTGTCGGTKTPENPPENPPAPKNNPNNDTPNNNNNGSGTSVGGCSSINGGNGNGDELKGKDGKEEDDEVKNDLPENTTPTPEQPVNPATPAEPSTPPNNPSVENGNQTDNSSVENSESSDSTYGAPTDSRRVTEVIGVGTTHQNVHTGIDIGALEPGVKGDPIYAVADGEIMRVGETKSKSSILVLDLPNTNDTAVYQHAEFIVTEGSVVKKGDVIGYMSDIGTPGQVHLHFEIRQDGLYAGDGGTGELVNPLDYLSDTYTVVNQ